MNGSKYVLQSKKLAGFADNLGVECKRKREKSGMDVLAWESGRRDLPLTKTGNNGDVKLPVSFEHLKFEKSFQDLLNIK